MKKAQNATADFSKAMEKLQETREIEPVMLLKLSDIIYPEFRTRSSVNEKSQLNLTENIRSAGLLSPILVRQKGNKYEIISGVKRVMAVHELGMTHITAFIIEKCDDKKAMLLSISDNLNRDDLNAFDQVFSMIRLMAVTLDMTEEEVKAILTRIDNFEKGKIIHFRKEDKDAEKTIAEILSKFGRLKLSSFILKMKVLEIHPLLIDAVRNKGLNYSFALEIDKIKDEEKMKELLEKVLDKAMPLKELKVLVQEILGTPAQGNPFSGIYRKLKTYLKLPKEKQLLIHQKIQEIELILAG